MSCLPADPIRPARTFRICGPDGVFKGECDKVRIIRRTPETGGPKGIALYTASDGRKMAGFFRPGSWT